MLLMEGADKVTHVWAEDTFHRALIWRYHVDLKLTPAQRCSGLKTDEACPDHRDPASRLGKLNNCLAVGQRP